MFSQSCIKLIDPLQIFDTVYFPITAQFEKRQLEGSVRPEKTEDFDRMVLQSPDSSLVWIRYMAHHLESSEIEKAQAVAERALKTISFR